MRERRSGASPAAPRASLPRIFDAHFGWLNTANPEGAGDYLAARARGRTAERMLLLGGWDKRLLYLTRKVALLGIDSAAYRAWCKTELFDDFGRELTALLDAGLLAQVGERLELTPEGMFHGDTIAGTLAWRRVRSVQALDVVEPNKHRLSYDEELDASVYSAMG